MCMCVKAGGCCSVFFFDCLPFCGVLRNSEFTDLLVRSLSFPQDALMLPHEHWNNGQAATVAWHLYGS